MAHVQIYQLMVRHFGNTNESRIPNGTIEENGCGKFDDITDKALLEIRNMGFTHVWFTGVLEHASGTSYPERPADPDALLKGKAGSPYAVKDYFDVCPDLANSFDTRLEEFRELLGRARSIGLETVIDFIPNHVARSYGSDVRADIDFGTGDKRDRFYSPNNNFFYLEGDGPLTLPTGEYEPEREVGKVTGNNAITWNPSVHDWYETVKLNYGFDFRKGNDTSELKDLEFIPDTWLMMDAVLAHWQRLGVRGFRCDMAHMVPVEFWKWVIEQARERDADVYFTGEAYDLDPAKLTNGNILHELLEAGYNSVYDSETYDVVKEIYEGNKWANDIDDVLWDERRLHEMLRYVENHDEVRVASPKNWGGHGALVGRAASAILLGIGRSANLIYSGQEVGEPAEGSEGFCGDEGRTSIFDYWCPPEMTKWVNNHQFDGKRLSEEQLKLREWYRNWMILLREPAFTDGKVYGLNGANKENSDYGRIAGETYSGHWLYSYLRYTEEQCYLVVVNLHPSETMQNIKIQIPKAVTNYTEGESILCVESIAPCEVYTKLFDPSA